MTNQNYNNHIRFYTPHHFIYYPVILFLTGLSIYFAFTRAEYLVWAMFAVLFIILFCLAFMLRQHYALTLQNRIVKLELRYRYFSLTGKRFEMIEAQLNDSQIFSLRFAPDEELIQLIEKTIAENLDSKSIKKSIVKWKGDYERV
ncbi:DUF6526 family protein [Flavobacterium sp. ST-87]|uniref:DUF6526 family protein n=1 Tax=Flavobacterium plantiphilum TaxID=3163297 RepID=A0ABW8XP37_9FLAO